MKRDLKLWPGLALAALCLVFVATAPVRAATPVWGAHESRSVDTPPQDLKPGEWIWAGDDKSIGPMVVVASIDEQRMHVYRNGIEIAVSTISTGKPGHETPTGVFTILEKDKDHHSRTYNNAPMPYEQRLTWEGIAIHAGGLPGYPESHGCLHLPTEFARRLFDATQMGMTVVIANQGTAPAEVVHPGLVAPVDARSGKPVAAPSLAAGQPYWWQPARAPDGALALLLSRSDMQIVAMRGGIEIGRASALPKGDWTTSGTHVYVMGSDYMDGRFPQFPQGKAPRWHAYAVPGHAADAGAVLGSEAINQVTLPPGFVAQVYPLLKPGTILVATDAPLSAATTAKAGVRVIDALPPAEGKRSN